MSKMYEEKSAWFRGSSVWILFALLHWAALAWADAGTGEPYRVDWRVPIPMRDGVRLNATIYRPDGAAARPQPVILTITPYSSDGYHPDAVYFAQRGYVYAVVDVRGRGNSEGKFEPWVMRESEDVHDATEWLARQPWANGKVGMQGSSYSGHNQWLAAKARSSHLATVVPVASGRVGYDFPYRNNRAMLFASQWLMVVDGASFNTNIGFDIPHWEAQLSALYREGRPYAALAKQTGLPQALFDEWVSHPSWGPYWEARNPTAADLAKFDLPILSITGYYDGDQLGALKMYSEHMKAASAEARDKHFLIIGPWSHAGTRRPTLELGGYTFGEASVLDMQALNLAWYDWTMKGGPKPQFLKNRVAYFAEGDNQWRYAPTLESVHNRELILHLRSAGGGGNGPFDGGKLATSASSASGVDEYVYDPRELPPMNASSTFVNPRLLVDLRSIMDIRNDAVVYTSEPFERSVLVAGAPRLEAWIEMDVPDTDLLVSLYELRSDGSGVLLTGDTLRARYRESRAMATLVPSGKVSRYTFDTFDFFSRRIAQGSRLCLILSGPRSLNFELNFNGGGEVAHETLQDARRASVRLHSGGRYPSSLVLPVIAEERTAADR